MRERLKLNLDQVHSRIAAAAKHSRRDPQAVRLVAITKYVDASTAAILVELGCLDLGESRPQLLWEKAAALNNPAVRWHQVGPLQRNKIRRTLPIVSIIHSIDSFHLAHAVDRIANELTRTNDILLEVNVSNESSKQGLAAPQVESALVEIAALSSVRVIGLMCMSGLQSTASEKQQQFANLRELRDHLQHVVPQGNKLRELSMGMSDDFESAIAEGATIVRLGSVLFANVENLNT